MKIFMKPMTVKKEIPNLVTEKWKNVVTVKIILDDNEKIQVLTVY